MDTHTSAKWTIWGLNITMITAHPWTTNCYNAVMEVMWLRHDIHELPRTKWMPFLPTIKRRLMAFAIISSLEWDLLLTVLAPGSLECCGMKRDPDNMGCKVPLWHCWVCKQSRVLQSRFPCDTAEYASRVGCCNEAQKSVRRFGLSA